MPCIASYLATFSQFFSSSPPASCAAATAALTAVTAAEGEDTAGEVRVALADVANGAVDPEEIEPDLQKKIEKAARGVGRQPDPAPEPNSGGKTKPAPEQPPE